MTEDDTRAPRGWKIVVVAYIALVGLFFFIYEVAGVELEGDARPTPDYEPLLPAPESWVLPMLVALGIVIVCATAVNINKWYRSRD